MSFWVVVLGVGLVSSGLLIMSLWRTNFLTALSTLVSPNSAPGVWYSKLDHLNANVLLFWEFMLVVGVAIVIYLKSRQDSRRFKIRTGQRLR